MSEVHVVEYDGGTCCVEVLEVVEVSNPQSGFRHVLLCPCGLPDSRTTDKAQRAHGRSWECKQSEQRIEDLSSKLLAV